MLKKYFPDSYEKDVFKIDYQKLYDKGIRGLIFDIDNTLVHHGDDSNQRVDSFMTSLKNLGFKILFLSDNSKERIERFNKNIQAPYIARAEKPKPENFLQAVKILDLKKESVLVIGDQIFKDILGANNSGLKSILVHYITKPGQKIGKQRYIEKLIIFFFTHFKPKERKTRKLFCQMNPLFYKISVAKEIAKRHIKNMTSRVIFSKEKNSLPLPNLVYRVESNLIKKGKGIDITLQQNKAVNIRLASAKIMGIIIKPQETFSFWKTVGKISRFRGYKKGRILINNKLIPGTGGGLCNLANSINLTVLHSPLEITELHFHSDCLAPEKEHNIFSSGTSIDYNYIDYRFKNTSSQNFQLLCFCDEEKLYVELRSENPISFDYKLSEEDRHYVKEKDKYFCYSRIYKEKLDKKTGVTLEKKLIRNNHSEVMYDYSQIPQG